MCRFRMAGALLVATAGWATEREATAARATGTGEDCVSAAPAAPEMVARTIYVPQYTTEKRVVRRVVCEPVERERVVTVVECVPETRTVEQPYTSWETRQRTRTVHYTVRKPVFETHSREVQVQVPVWETRQQTYQVRIPVRREVAEQYVVQVPHREQRQAMRTVCRTIPVKETRTVTCDNGHWEMQTIEAPCDGCGGGWFGRRRGCCADDCCGTQMACRRVWVPQVETKRVEVTVYRPRMEQVPYTYTQVVYRPETRTRTVSVCDYRTESRTRDVRVCRFRPETRTVNYRTCRWVAEERSRDVGEKYCVPVTKTRSVQVTSIKQVPREKTVRYVEYVPREVEREIEVPVCRMVAKTVMVPACEDNDCYDCYGFSSRRHWRRGCW